jgi:copper homeostasis protein
MPILIEACVDSLSGARLAQQLGADRLELCANLNLGGTTPPAGLLRLVRAQLRLPIHVLIRPRAGNFVYTPAEQETILAEIEWAASAGADGIVCGALTAEGALDAALTAACITAANGLPFTFHRAFDACPEPFTVLRQLGELGAARVLTSGQAPDAAQGLPRLRELTAAAGTVGILPGGGITPENIGAILRELHPAEIHFSGTRLSADGQYRLPDPERLAALIAAVRG